MNVGGWRILQAIRRVRMADVYIARNIISRILYLGDPLSKCNIACCNPLEVSLTRVFYCTFPYRIDLWHLFQ
jgi:hypothetical protein